MAYAPEYARRDEHFMLVVAIDLALDADIGCREPGDPRRWPVAVNPATVDLDLKNWRQQTRERPVETVIDSATSFYQMIQGRKIRNDSFVCDGRIVEREGPDEKAIAGNSVCVCRMR